MSTSLEQILKDYFGTGKPVLKHPVRNELGENTRYLTRSGSKAYGKLISLLYDLETLFPDVACDSEKISAAVKARGVEESKPNFRSETIYLRNALSEAFPLDCRKSSKNFCIAVNNLCSMLSDVFFIVYGDVGYASKDSLSDELSDIIETLDDIVDGHSYGLTNDELRRKEPT